MNSARVKHFDVFNVCFLTLSLIWFKCSLKMFYLGSVLILCMYDSSVKRSYHISKVLNNINCYITSVARVYRKYYVITVT